MQSTKTGHPLPTRTWPLFLGLFVAVCGLLAACGDNDAKKELSPAPLGAPRVDTNTVVIPDVSETPGEAAARIAKALAAARTLEEARPLVLEVLARCGAPVQTASGDLRAQAVEPALDSWFFDFQADNLALDHIQSQGLTMEQLARSMAECPVEGADFWADPIVLREFLRQMWLAADADPTDPRSFGPLLLAELAARHDPADDMTSGTADTRGYPMSYLEILVFSLSAQRGLPGRDEVGMSGVSPERSRLAQVKTVDCGPGSGQEGLPMSFVGRACAGESNPCSWIEQAWGKDIKDFVGGGVGLGTDLALGKTAEAATRLAGEGVQKGAQAAASAIGYVTAFVSLVGTMGGYSLEVKPEPAKAHYYGAGPPSHGNLTVKFVAHVSSRPVADRDLQSCLEWAGVELPDEKSAENAIVRWVGLYGTETNGKPRHAQWSAHNTAIPGGSRGRYEMKVGPDRTAELFLDMTSEKRSDLVKRKAPVRKDKIVVQAELFVQNPNDGKILGMLFLGTSEALKAWADKWFPKRVVSTMPVEYHADGRWGFRENQDAAGVTVVNEGRAEEGLFGPWVITAAGSGKVAGAPVTAYIDERIEIDMIEGRPAPINGESMFSTSLGSKLQGKIIGQAWIEGTDEEHVLVLERTTSGTATDSGGHSAKASGKVTERYKLEFIEEE